MRSAVGPEALRRRLQGDAAAPLTLPLPGKAGRGAAPALHPPAAAGKPKHAAAQPTLRNAESPVASSAAAAAVKQAGTATHQAHPAATVSPDNKEPRPTASEPPSAETASQPQSADIPQRQQQPEQRQQEQTDCAISAVPSQEAPLQDQQRLCSTQRAAVLPGQHLTAEPAALQPLSAPPQPQPARPRPKPSGPPPGFGPPSSRRPPPGFEVPSRTVIGSGLGPATTTAAVLQPLQQQPLHPAGSDSSSAHAISAAGVQDLDTSQPTSPLLSAPLTPVPSSSMFGRGGHAGRQSRFSFAREQAEARAATDAASAVQTPAAAPAHLNGGSALLAALAASHGTASCGIAARLPGTEPDVPQPLREQDVAAGVMQQGGQQQAGAALLRQLQGLGAAVAASPGGAMARLQDPAIMSAHTPGGGGGGAGSSGNPAAEPPTTSRGPPPGFGPPTARAASARPPAPAAPTPPSGGSAAWPQGRPTTQHPTVAQPIPGKAGSNSGNSSAVPATAPMAASPRSSRGGKKKRGGKGRGGAPSAAQ